MNCPKCKSATYVKDSRPTGASVRRRRVCKCGFAATTFEAPLDLTAMLDGLRQRLRFLEEEVAGVVDLARQYMGASRIKRPKRGASRLRRINPELLRHRRARVEWNDTEKRRLIEAYKESTAKELAAAYGLSSGHMRALLSRLGIRKRNTTGNGFSRGRGGTAKGKPDAHRNHDRESPTRGVLPQADRFQ